MQRMTFQLAIMGVTALVSPVLAQTTTGGSERVAVGAVSGGWRLFEVPSDPGRAAVDAAANSRTPPQRLGTGAFSRTAPGGIRTGTPQAVPVATGSPGLPTRTGGTTGAAQPPPQSVGGINPGTAGNLNYDRRFLVSAAQMSLKEIGMGQTGLENSANPTVRALAERLIADHTASLEEAAALADALGVTVPDTLSRSDERLLGTLADTSTARFDRQFVARNIADHRSAINQFLAAAERARDPEVRAFARAQLPTLMMHLVMALEARETI